MKIKELFETKVQAPEEVIDYFQQCIDIGMGPGNMFFNLEDKILNHLRYGRFSELEEWILSDSALALAYVQWVVENRWIEAEPILKTDLADWFEYISYLKGKGIEVPQSFEDFYNKNEKKYLGDDVI